MKKLIIFLSLFLSLNLSAQFRSTSMYVDNMQQVEQHTYQSADEYLQSVSYNPYQGSSTTTYYSAVRKAPGKPNDPFPTPVGDVPLLVMTVLVLGYGVYKFVKEYDK